VAFFVELMKFLRNIFNEIVYFLLPSPKKEEEENLVLFLLMHSAGLGSINTSRLV
jgi:hypothetical protein